jgi:hypothetical protein
MEDLQKNLKQMAAEESKRLNVPKNLLLNAYRKRVGRSKYTPHQGKKECLKRL